ncbi:MAG: zinc-binding dehydrogenase [Cryobacterium sp.]|nr:zinc-binding dehydrogenase [Cryobacterium sp.]
MKASVLFEHGGPEKLTLSEVDEPTVLEGETLIRVGAAGVEPGLDIKTRQDGGGWPIDLPHILGASMAGTVMRSVGEGALAEGTRVAVAPVISCGVCRFCRTGRDNSCQSRRFMGINRPGGYAEYCAVPSRNLIPIADSTSFAVAAGASVSYSTAWHSVVSRARVSPADTVFVVGSSGSVGIAAAQAAALFGARVILGGRDRRKVAPLAAEVGAAGIVDTAGDIPAQLAQLAPEGVDLVVDTVGPATWASSVAVLNPEGRLVCVGGSSGGEVGLTLRDVYRKNVSLFFSTSSPFEQLKLVYRLIDEGKLAPKVYAEYPLADAAAAHAAMVEQKHVGKVVIVPEGA